MSPYKFLFTLVCTAVPSLASNAAVLSLVPSSPSVEVGRTFTVDVTVSDLGAGNALGVYDFDVVFDAAQVSFSGVAFGTGLDVLGLGSIQAATPGTGLVNLYELSLDTASDLSSLQPRTFVLAALRYSAHAPGVGSFALSVKALGDAFGDPLSANVVNTTVELVGTSPVPEPPPALLLTVATGALSVLLGRRGASRRSQRRPDGKSPVSSMMTPAR